MGMLKLLDHACSISNGNLRSIILRIMRKIQGGLSTKQLLEISMKNIILVTLDMAHSALQIKLKLPKVNLR